MQNSLAESAELYILTILGAKGLDFRTAIATAQSQGIAPNTTLPDISEDTDSRDPQEILLFVFAQAIALQSGVGGELKEGLHQVDDL